MFLSSVLNRHLSYNIQPHCCTIQWFTTSQLWLTVGCRLNCQQRVISRVPMEQFVTGSCLWWLSLHLYTCCCCCCSLLWVVITESSRHTYFIWVAFIIKTYAYPAQGRPFFSKPDPTVPHNVLLMLQQELSVWSGCGLAPKKSGNETWPA